MLLLPLLLEAVAELLQAAQLQLQQALQLADRPAGPNWVHHPPSHRCCRRRQPALRQVPGAGASLRGKGTLLQQPLLLSDARWWLPR